MRLLLLTETVPHPLDSGGRIKTRYTLEALARRHRVTCHTFIRDIEQEPAAREALGPLCERLRLHHVPRRLATELWHVARSAVTARPLTVDRHFSADVLEAIRRDMCEEPFDAVYCDHLSMLEYGRRVGLPIIHDAHNVEHEIVRRFATSAPRPWMRAAASVEWRLLRRYERREYRRCDLVFAVSDHDATRIRELSGAGIEVVPVPIGVSTTVTELAPLVTGPRVLFVGGLAWPPNADAVAWLADEIWPSVVADLPTASLSVVGGGTPPVLCRGAAGVSFEGYVDDVTPWFRESRAMAAPLRSGSGLRVKILEAFARGVPVVATTIGAEGLAVTDGEHLLIADTPTDFARALVRVLTDDDLAHQLAAAARQLVVERYDEARVGEQTCEAIDRWAQRRATPREISAHP